MTVSHALFSIAKPHMLAPHPLYTVESIRAIESAYLADAQPSLMERAGAAAARWALELAAERPGPILILAGPGNNGGDGFVAARHLLQAGRGVVMVFDGDPQHLLSDAAAAYTAWRAAGGQVAREFLPGSWALAIDALFGIGLKRPLEGKFAEWVERFNACNCPRLALDCPSGLDADTGRILGCAVRATHTLSFIALKPGLLTLDGPDCCGVVQTDALGLPLERHAASGTTLAPALFAPCLAPRRLNSHKGRYGDVGIVGGAPGMVGAAWLAGRAAVHLGAGRVFVGCLDDAAPALDPVCPELMVRPASEVPALASVLAFGPGLGQSDSAAGLLMRALPFDGPLVLDADALNLVGASPTMQARLAARTAPSLLTPHPAEAGRLLQQTVAQIQADRIAAASELASRYHAYIVLKGCGSVVAQPDGSWVVNTSGHPGMASGGMGDVLTGLLASLLAQGWPAGRALQAAVHLHGAAADALAHNSVGPVGLTASEVSLAARRVFNQWITEAAQPPANICIF